MSILQTTELKKYYGAEPNITRALADLKAAQEKLMTSAQKLFAKL